ncbi:MAG TPA: AAA family ATPase [Anaerolineae bacterium]|nr:AAA family ATPase [Anaerolineae bacterium]
MKCSNCGNDNPSGARFCLNCGTALALRCPGCARDLPPGARFCMHCGQPQRPTTPADDAQLSRLAAATPDSLAEKLRAADGLAGERRVVTVLFTDVVGSTDLAHVLGPEAWMVVIKDMFDRITPVIYRYEGTIAHLLGDGLWAFFGAPVAHEDDPLRAAYAGLDLLHVAAEYADQVRREYGVEFAMRACLNTGPVVVGPLSDDLRYEHTAGGPTVNLAARLKFVAQPMSLVVTEHTHRFIAPIFETEDVGQVSVEGDDVDAVRVYQVRGLRSAPGRLRGLAGAGLESPMVGRDAELATLLQLGEAVRAGLGRAALIVGEPGLGKTRLITEWRAALARHPAQPPPLWAEGRCLSYGRGLAYHLLIDLLRSILGVAEAADEVETREALRTVTDELFGEEASGVYPYLGHLLSVRLHDRAAEDVALLDPQALQAQYLAAVRRLLGALAARQPLILILEDLHWADPSSTDLLIKLLPLASAAPVLLCMATRPERDAPAWRLVTAARETLGGSLTEITLHALSESDSRQLVANLLQIEALPESVRAVILKKAEGNPFFVEEVIRMLIDRGAILRRGDDWVAGAGIEQVEIPDNLHSLLLARIDRLPDDVRHTLRVAAVIGRQFPVKVLEYVLRGGEPQ